MDSSGKKDKTVSETKEKFVTPRRYYPPSTQNRRFHQFFCDELFKEYERSKEYDYRVDESLPMGTTEYREKYAKEFERESEQCQAALKVRYPLYNSGIITFYNQTGDPLKDHRRRNSLATPLAENKEQFG